MKIFRKGLAVPSVRKTLAKYAKSRTMEKFINALLSDILTAYGEALEKLREIHEGEKSFIKEEDYTTYVCKTSLKFGYRGFWVLEILCNHAKEAVVDELFIPRIAKLVNMLASSFYGKNAERYQISRADDVKLKQSKILRGVVSCSAGLSDSEGFIREVVNGNEYFQLDALKRSARAARVLSAADYDCTLIN
jgi:hypothetical protein